jgi:hypothetical protein
MLSFVRSFFISSACNPRSSGRTQVFASEQARRDPSPRRALAHFVGQLLLPVSDRAVCVCARPHPMLPLPSSGECGERVQQLGSGTASGVEWRAESELPLPTPAWMSFRSPDAVHPLPFLCSCDSRQARAVETMQTDVG